MYLYPSVIQAREDFSIKAEEHVIRGKLYKYARFSPKTWIITNETDLFHRQA